ncbi:hypothetical protein D3C72_1095050 [compost metagenome]
MLGALNGLGTKIDCFSAKLETKPTPEQPAPTITESTNEEKPGITADRFSKLEETLNGLASTVGELKGQIDQFSVEKPGQRPGALGGDDTPAVY